MSKRRTPFANHNGTLYVRVSDVMHPLVVLFDGIPVTFFNKNRKAAYITVDQALEWCRKEQEFTRAKPQAEKIEALEKAKATFAAGEFKDNK